jgi:hypothetical protein
MPKPHRKDQHRSSRWLFQAHLTINKRVELLNPFEDRRITNSGSPRIPGSVRPPDQTSPAWRLVGLTLLRIARHHPTALMLQQGGGGISA